MMDLITVLSFIALYGLSMIGDRKGQIFFMLGLLVHAGYVLYRTVHLGWLPVTARHDILLVIALFVAFSFYYFQKKAPLNMVLDVLPLFVVVLSGFAVFQEIIDTIDPNMNSIWFFVYISFFIAGSSFFVCSSIAGMLYLKESSVLYETIQHRLALFGWLLFSFSLIGGSVWFFLTYGSYWLWTAKELWITIVWFYYSFYLHGRLLKSLRGKPSAVLGITGFPILIFAYLGVMPLLGSPWTQF